jgi:undecaprenyl diphosphate synthase
MGAPEFSAEAVPQHVAIIMDGNGRWAERRGLPRSDGHKAGVEAVRVITRAARDAGVGWLTLYAFSSENWNRPQEEVAVLMQLPALYFETELSDAMKNDVRIRAIGRRDRLPPDVRATIGEAESKTRNNGGLQLTFALSYGGRAEIVDAARRLMRAAETGGLDPGSLDEKSFAAHLDDPELPDVDLLIRTGGEQRISNFLLWQTAYAELHWTEKMWPEFGREEFFSAIRVFESRERRFGLTGAQARGEGA